MKVLVINGPNLNMLGIREPGIYGNGTYAELVEMVEKKCHEDGIKVEIYQSNHEGDLVDKIQDALGKFDGIVTYTKSAERGARDLHECLQESSRTRNWFQYLRNGVQVRRQWGLRSR